MPLMGHQCGRRRKKMERDKGVDKGDQAQKHPSLCVSERKQNLKG